MKGAQQNMKAHEKIIMALLILIYCGAITFGYARATVKAKQFESSLTRCTEYAWALAPCDTDMDCVFKCRAMGQADCNY